MTLDELIRELGYDPQSIKDMKRGIGEYQRMHGHLQLKDIQPEIITEAISYAHISHW